MTVTSLGQACWGEVVVGWLVGEELGDGGRGVGGRSPGVGGVASVVGGGCGGVGGAWVSIAVGVVVGGDG